MDMGNLQNNLEEYLGQIDILTKERDTLKKIYNNAKEHIGKLKDKIDYLKSKKDSKYYIKFNNEVSRIKK